MSKKRKAKKSQRPTALILLIVILAATNIATFAYFAVFDTSVPLEDVPMSIADLMGDNSSLGKMVSVLGYYVYTAGYHLLVSNPASFFNNSLTRTNHMVITGDVPESLADHAGFQICVKGILGLFEPDGDTGTIGFDSFFDVETEITFPGTYLERKLDPAPLLLQYPDIFLMPYDPDEEKYAILYSGGINEEKAYYRYWNDIIYMKFILEMHGYDPANIYVVYKDGLSEDGGVNPVHFPATHASMDIVFGILAAEMGARDTLFFYTTNHGGYGGISVWNPMDSSGALTHSEVSNWLDSITCNNMIIVMEQCVSGAFISHLSAEDRVILTACKDDEGSGPCDTEGCWDEFVYHFMCALVSFSFHDPISVVDADYNTDGLISLKEAFIYAAITDSKSETPWYNDFYNGSTQGYHVWQVAYALPGSPGENVFL
ncbi:MAG: C13 family peptidase [Candidatus Thorarchaeota archaeon]